MPRDSYTADAFEVRYSVVMKEHVSREDQMGDTTRDVVLAERTKKISPDNIKIWIDRVENMGKLIDK